MKHDDQAIVLVVDDEAANLSVLFTHLRSAGLKVLVAEDASSALASVKHTIPDIMLLDIKLPDIDGFELYKQLRLFPELNETPAIFLSVLADTSEKLKAFELNAVDYVTKPFEPVELLARMQKHLTIRNLRRQLKEQNLQLQRQNAILKAQRDAALDGLLVVDEQRRVTYYNQEFLNIWRIPAEAVQDSDDDTLLEYVLPQLPEPEAFAAQIEELYHRPDTVSADEILLWDGRVIERRSAPTVLQEKEKCGRVWYFRDVTEQKQMIQKAEDANQAKSRFLANMSHELRTPLNAILGFSQIMARNPDIPATARENLAVIQQSGEHLLDLINQVLDLSKIESGRTTVELETCDLKFLCDSLYDMFSIRAGEKNLRLDIIHSDAMPRHIITDQTKLRQILINLLGNAIKFTEKGGVTVKILDLGFEIFDVKNAPQSKISNVKFEIEDTGPGIAPEEMESVFDAFAQTDIGKQASEGTGLGLSISRKFARLLGGDITVASQVGQGTTFSVTIQAEIPNESAIATPQASHADRVVALAPGQPHYRMLVVDDKADNRQVLIGLLQSVTPSGSDVEFLFQEAEHGVQALTIWKTWQPHILWLDMKMPVMNGYEVAREIRRLETQHGRDETRTKIIAVTADSFNDARSHALAEGCDGFVRKPFRDSEIFEQLQQQLGVQILYEEDASTSASPARTDGDSAMPEALAALPPAIQAELRLAVERIDVRMTVGVIEQIRRQNPALADVLTALIKKFRFDTLQELLKTL